MKINKVEKLVLLFICLSLLVGSYTIYQRVEVEKQYKTAEIILDYNEMEKFADSSEHSISYWLGLFKEYKAQSVAVQEETIKRLIEKGKPLKAEITSELVKNYGWQQNYDEKIVNMIDENEIGRNDVVVTTEDDQLFNYIMSGLKERYSSKFFISYNLDGVYYIVLKGTNDYI